jgi:hypothetical protein
MNYLLLSWVEGDKKGRLGPVIVLIAVVAVEIVVDVAVVGVSPPELEWL